MKLRPLSFAISFAIAALGQSSLALPGHNPCNNSGFPGKGGNALIFPWTCNDSVSSRYANGALQIVSDSNGDAGFDIDAKTGQPFSAGVLSLNVSGAQSGDLISVDVVVNGSVTGGEGGLTLNNGTFTTNLFGVHQQNNITQVIVVIDSPNHSTIKFSNFTLDGKALGVNLTKTDPCPF
jgi:hypothetical protein